MRRLRMNHPSAVLKNYSKATGNKRVQVTVIATVSATMAMKANDSIRNEPHLAALTARTI